MTTLTLLQQGYAHKNGDAWIANAGSCLIISDTGKKIITDPGCNRKKLFTVLAREGFSTTDMDYVFMTHAHPDHILLAGLFENAKHITYNTNLLYNGDHIRPWETHELGPDIEIIETPGHVLEHISLIAQTEKGRVGIAGDAIWWQDNEPQTFSLHQKDRSETRGMNMGTLVASRKKLLEMSDYIVPGHGDMFKVDKKMYVE